MFLFREFLRTIVGGGGERKIYATGGKSKLHIAVNRNVRVLYNKQSKFPFYSRFYAVFLFLTFSKTLNSRWSIRCTKLRRLTTIEA